MMEHRLQLLLDEERYHRVSTLAKQRHMSVAAVIREAIDRGLPAAPRQRSAAADRILAADPAQVGDVEDLIAELNDLRGRAHDRP